MNSALLPLLVLGALSTGPQTEQKQERYTFRSWILPDAQEPGERLIKKTGAIATARIIPVHLAALDRDVEFAEEKIVLRARTQLTLTEAGVRIGCTLTQLAEMSAIGARYVCFIDTNGNGQFDHWFKRGESVFANGGSRPARIPYGRMYEIPEVGFAFRPSEEATGGISVELRWSNGEFRICYKEYPLCTTDGSRVDFKKLPAPVALLGAEYEISEFSNGLIRVRDIVPLKKQEF